MADSEEVRIRIRRHRISNPTHRLARYGNSAGSIFQSTHMLSHSLTGC